MFLQKRHLLDVLIGPYAFLFFLFLFILMTSAIATAATATTTTTSAITTSNPLPHPNSATKEEEIEKNVVDSLWSFRLSNVYTEYLSLSSSSPNESNSKDSSLSSSVVYYVEGQLQALSPKSHTWGTVCRHTLDQDISLPINDGAPPPSQNGEGKEPIKRNVEKEEEPTEDRLQRWRNALHQKDIMDPMVSSHRLAHFPASSACHSVSNQFQHLFDVPNSVAMYNKNKKGMFATLHDFSYIVPNSHRTKTLETQKKSPVEHIEEAHGDILEPVLGEVECPQGNADDGVVDLAHCAFKSTTTTHDQHVKGNPQQLWCGENSFVHVRCYTKEGAAFLVAQQQQQMHQAAAPSLSKVERRDPNELVSLQTDDYKNHNGVGTAPTLPITASKSTAKEQPSFPSSADVAAATVPVENPIPKKKRHTDGRVLESDVDPFANRAALPEHRFSVVVGYPYFEGEEGREGAHASTSPINDGFRAAAQLQQELLDFFQISYTQVRVSWWNVSSQTAQHVPSDSSSSSSSSSTVEWVSHLPFLCAGLPRWPTNGSVPLQPDQWTSSVRTADSTLPPLRGNDLDATTPVRFFILNISFYSFFETTLPPTTAAPPRPTGVPPTAAPPTTTTEAPTSGSGLLDAEDPELLRHVDALILSRDIGFLLESSAPQVLTPVPARRTPTAAPITAAPTPAPPAVSPTALVAAFLSLTTYELISAFRILTVTQPTVTSTAACPLSLRNGGVAASWTRPTAATTTAPTTSTTTPLMSGPQLAFEWTATVLATQLTYQSIQFGTQAALPFFPTSSPSKRGLSGAGVLVVTGDNNIAKSFVCSRGIKAVPVKAAIVPDVSIFQSEEDATLVAATSRTFQYPRVMQSDVLSPPEASKSPATTLPHFWTPLQLCRFALENQSWVHPTPLAIPHMVTSVLNDDLVRTRSIVRASLMLTSVMLSDVQCAMSASPSRPSTGGSWFASRCKGSLSTYFHLDNGCGQGSSLGLLCGSAPPSLDIASRLSPTLRPDEVVALSLMVPRPDAATFFTQILQPALLELYGIPPSRLLQYGAPIPSATYSDLAELRFVVLHPWSRLLSFRSFSDPSGLDTTSYDGLQEETAAAQDVSPTRYHSRAQLLSVLLSLSGSGLTQLGLPWYCITRGGGFKEIILNVTAPLQHYPSPPNTDNSNSSTQQQQQPPAAAPTQTLPTTESDIFIWNARINIQWITSAAFTQRRASSIDPNMFYDDADNVGPVYVQLQYVNGTYAHAGLTMLNELMSLMNIQNATTTTKTTTTTTDVSSSTKTVVTSVGLVGDSTDSREEEEAVVVTASMEVVTKSLRVSLETGDTVAHDLVVLHITPQHYADFATFLLTTRTNPLDLKMVVGASAPPPIPKPPSPPASTEASVPVDTSLSPLADGVVIFLCCFVMFSIVFFLAMSWYVSRANSAYRDKELRERYINGMAQLSTPWFFEIHSKKSMMRGARRSKNDRNNLDGPSFDNVVIRSPQVAAAERKNALLDNTGEDFNRTATWVGGQLKHYKPNYRGDTIDRYNNSDDNDDEEEEEKIMRNLENEIDDILGTDEGHNAQRKMHKEGTEEEDTMSDDAWLHGYENEEKADFLIDKLNFMTNKKAMKKQSAAPEIREWEPEAIGYRLGRGGALIPVLNTTGGNDPFTIQARGRFDHDSVMNDGLLEGLELMHWQTMSNKRLEEKRKGQMKLLNAVEEEDESDPLGGGGAAAVAAKNTEVAWMDALFSDTDRLGDLYVSKKDNSTETSGSANNKGAGTSSTPTTAPLAPGGGGHSQLDSFLSSLPPPPPLNADDDDFDPLLGESVLLPPPRQHRTSRRVDLL